MAPAAIRKMLAPIPMCSHLPRMFPLASSHETRVGSVYTACVSTHPEEPTPQESPEDIEHRRALERDRRRRLVKFLVAAIIVVVLIVFVVQNADETDVDFVFFTVRARLIWVLLGTATLGVVVGYLLGRPGKQLRLHRRDRD